MHSRFTSRLLICARLAQALPVVALAGIFAGCSSGQDEVISVRPADYPRKFVETGRYSTLNRTVVFLDLNNDGTDERLTLSASERPNASNLVVNQANESVIDQVNFGPCQSMEFQFAYDLNHDGDRDLFVVTRERDTLFMNVVDIYHTTHSSLLARFPLSWREDSLVRFLPEQSVRFSGIVEPAPGRPHRILIGTVSSYMSKTPRGVLAYDLDTPRLLWFYATGPLPDDPLLLAGRNGGDPVMFFGSRAPDNGSAANGTDDAHSYLFGLGIDGKQLWPPRRLGSEFSQTRIFIDDINDDGNDEILCLFSSASKVYEKSCLKFFSPVSGAQIGSTRAFDSQIIMPESNPLLRFRQKAHFGVVLASGALVVLDSSFNQVVKKDLPIEPESIQFLDVDRDGKTDIIVTLKTGQTICLDASLDPLLFLAGRFALRESNCNQSRRPTLVLQAGDQMIMGNIEPGPKVINFWLLMGALVVATTAGAAVAGRFVYYYLLIRISGENAPTLAIMLLNRRGRVLYTNNTFERIFPAKKGPTRGKSWASCFDEPGREEIRSSLDRLIESRVFGERRLDCNVADAPANLMMRSHPITWHGVHFGDFVAFQEITQHVQRSRVLNWALIAQNLAHEMKTPLSTIWFTIARIRQQAEGGKASLLEEHLQSIEEEMRRVDNYVKGFMKLANINPPNLLATDVNKALQEILAPYREKLPQTIDIQMDLSADLPAVRLDVHMFTVAMRNLFDNAVSAMKGKGILKISTYLARNLNQTRVFVAISDTGCGIAEEDIPKLFQPYFSKSGFGSGLGLIITKKIVEDHDGRINFTTRNGLGTEFVVELPGSGPDGGERNAP